MLPRIKTTSAAAALVLVAALTGCASKQATLNIRPANGRTDYLQHFQRAYFTEDGSGTFDVVLTEDGLPATATARKDGALEAAPNAALRQFVHIRTSWKAPGTLRADAPAAVNAVVRLVFISGGEQGRAEVGRLEYQGGAVVRIDSGSRSASVRLRSGRIELKQREGDLNDPIGRADLSGTFQATRDDAAVAALLRTIRPPAPTEDFPGPPPRPPGGP